MSRSIWKPILLLTNHSNLRSIKVYPDLINKSLLLSNGLSLKSFTINNKWINHSLGDFYFTKKIPKFKNVKK